MIPPQPENSFRITLELNSKERRLDSVLMKALRDQKTNLKLQTLTRTEFKNLFKEKRILIKLQPANASSSLAAGTTYIDIIGFGENADSATKI
jgi:hypothetical protein